MILALLTWADGYLLQLYLAWQILCARVDRQASTAPKTCQECGFQWVTEWRESLRIMAPPSWWNHERPYPGSEMEVEMTLCTACGSSSERPC